MSIFAANKTFSRRSATALLAVGVLAGVAVGGGVGVGVIAASSTKTVTVCANKKTNILRYAKNGKCLKGETKVVLNQTGVTGATGATGIGLKGDPGTNGVNATLAITQQAVCDGVDADMIKNEICKIGMTGPSGGLIFFVDYNDEYAIYDYLEAAPTDGMFAGNSNFGPWATTVAKCGPTAPQATDCQTNSIYTEMGVAFATILGAHRGLFGGKAATALIVARHDAGTVAKNLYAAGVADDYAINGVSDWWLPSRDEMELLLVNLTNRGLGGFLNEFYMSSSESTGIGFWGRSFYNGFENQGPKAQDFYVRPVRAF
jgi:hypothetical protein